VIIACSHGGYKRLPGKPVHRRKWHLQTNRLIVTDHIAGTYNQAVARYIFQPAVLIEPASESRYEITLGTGHQIMLEVLQGWAQMRPAHCAMGFGQSIETQSLEVFSANDGVSVALSWPDALKVNR
jgi:hypothetical protein